MEPLNSLAMGPHTLPCSLLLLLSFLYSVNGLGEVIYAVNAGKCDRRGCYDGEDKQVWEAGERPGRGVMFLRLLIHGCCLRKEERGWHNWRF